MALRNIVKEGDDILRKKSRPVEMVTERITELLDDMTETMNANAGVGLAAPQVGILKRLCVIIPDPQTNEVHELINPQILETEGEQEGYEGCLSIPGYIGKVKRPQSIKIRNMDRDGNWQEEEYMDFGAVVVCHEMEHLDGILYTDKAEDVHIPSDDPEADDDEKKDQ